jgi:hypothetical protein
MRVVLAVLAVATWYVADDVPNTVGPYCGGPAPDRWVAIDAGLMYDGVVECGFKLTLYYPDIGLIDRVVVWDIGPLQSYGHYIEDYADLPYLLDVEHRAWPVALDGLLSARVLIVPTYNLPQPRGTKGVY